MNLRFWSGGKSSNRLSPHEKYPVGAMAKTTRARSSDITSMRTVFWCRGLGGLFRRTVRPDRWVTLENQARRAMICQ